MAREPLTPEQQAEEDRRHEEVLKMADDALDDAEMAISAARKKLARSERNYQERMRVPHPAVHSI